MIVLFVTIVVAAVSIVVVVGIVVILVVVSVPRAPFCSSFILYSSGRSCDHP